MRSNLVPVLTALCLAACGAEIGEAVDEGSAGTSGAAGAGQAGAGGLGSTSSWAGAAGTSSGGSTGSAGGTTSTGGAAGSSEPPVCDCFVSAAWCGAGVAQEAAKKGCTVPLLPAHKDDLLGCDGSKWIVKDDCKAGCKAMPAGTPDACALPVCNCFVQSAWCGSGAAKEAETLGCTIPLLPEHKGDILYCPNGKWSVKQSCAQGCVEAPSGTPDYCKSTTGDQNPVPGYKITTPFGKPGSWAAGYHTGDDYASPTGTKVVATRAGVVKAKSWSYWGSAYGLHVVIETNGVRHLYAHLSAASVSVGQTVAKGQKVGAVGSTGNSTGPHLHYEERVSPYGYSNHRNPQFNK
jgi:hypothetical protein